MRADVTMGWTGAVLATVAAAAAALGLAAAAQAQDFKIPLTVSQWVYDPGEEIVEPQPRDWTFGAGLLYGLNNQNGRGFAAQATHGGRYWYWAGGVGVWNGGFAGADDELGLGINFRYNVFESPDARTRVGPQFAWSTASLGNLRTHVATYRAMASHALGPTLSLYGGVGAETGWLSGNGSSISSTNVTLAGGVYTRLSARAGLSFGIESVFSDPTQVTFATSVQLGTGRD